MRYGLREYDIGALPPEIPVAVGDDGLGIVLRDGDALVGFQLIARPDAGAAIDARRLLDPPTREVVVLERLRSEMRARGPLPVVPSLTVAICSKDGPDLVRRLLASLRSVEDAEPFEMLVIDNASVDDRIAQVCAAHGRVRYVREPRAGLDFARNRALAEATTEVVAYLDDDVIVDRHWLRAMRRAWSDNPDADCVTGLVLPMALETEAQILFERRGGFRRGFRPQRYGPERFGHGLHPCGSGRFGAGANMSVRRDAVLRLGGFDEALDTGRPLPGGEDLDLFYRVLRTGSFLVYEPQAAVFHEHRRDLTALRRQYYTWGLGFAAFVTKSVDADPAMRARFRRMLAWWFAYQCRRVVDRLGARESTPLGMILGEIWGGLVGLAGEYARSQRRVAAIRAASPE